MARNSHIIGISSQKSRYLIIISYLIKTDAHSENEFSFALNLFVQNVENIIKQPESNSKRKP